MKKLTSVLLFAALLALQGVTLAETGSFGENPTANGGGGVPGPGIDNVVKTTDSGSGLHLHGMSSFGNSGSNNVGLYGETGGTGDAEEGGGGKRSPETPSDDGF